MKASYRISGLVAAIALTLAVPLAAVAAEKIGVNVTNYNNVETHMQMDRYQTVAGGINTFKHNREMVAIDKQTTIAMNRDTLYSLAVVNLSKPVTITFPEHGDRYMALQIIDQNHYTPMTFYKAGTHVLTEKNVGTPFAFVAVRTFVDPNSPADLKAVHALQDQLKIEGGGDAKLVLPDYDMTSYKGVFDNLLSLSKFWDGKGNSMGKRGEVNELYHTLATAVGWGLNATNAATYALDHGDYDPAKKYRIEVPADVPVKGFWSLSVYNKEGFFAKNKWDAYVINNVTGKKNADGSTTIFLGACEGEANCLPLPGVGSYLEWRFYLPGPSVLDGSWKSPKATAVK